MSFEHFVGISVNMHTKEPVDFSNTCYLIPRRCVGVLSRCRSAGQRGDSAGPRRCCGDGASTWSVLLPFL